MAKVATMYIVIKYLEHLVQIGSQLAWRTMTCPSPRERMNLQFFLLYSPFPVHTRMSKTNITLASE